MNNENRQLLMKQFAAFGAQMQMMPHLQSRTQPIAITTPAKATETPVQANETVPSGTNHLEPPPTGDTGLPPTDTDIAEGSEMNVEKFETIMLDAETRRRLAEK